MAWEVKASAEVSGVEGKGVRRRTAQGKTYVIGRAPLYFDSLPEEIATDDLLLKREVELPAGAVLQDPPDEEPLSGAPQPPPAPPAAISGQGSGSNPGTKPPNAKARVSATRRKG